MKRKLRDVAPAREVDASSRTMTREERLRAARQFLALTHPADKDEVTAALCYIEFRDRNFRATRQRYSKAAKRAADNIANAMVRGYEAGLPVPREWLLFYEHTANAKGYLGQLDLRPRRGEGFRLRLALHQAYWLLTDRGRRCAASRDSDWCKLAAILLGMPRVTAGLVSQARRVRAMFEREKMGSGTK